MPLYRDTNLTTVVTGTESGNLANGNRVISGSTSTGITSGVVDNATDLYMWADFEFTCTFASAPSAGQTVDLYLVPSVDNTNFADGDASIVPPTTYYRGSFVLRAVTSAQRVAVLGVPLPPEKFKVLLANSSGAALPSGGGIVKMQRYKV